MISVIPLSGCWSVGSRRRLLLHGLPHHEIVHRHIFVSVRARCAALFVFHRLAQFCNKSCVRSVSFAAPYAPIGPTIPIPLTPPFPPSCGLFFYAALAFT